MGREHGGRLVASGIGHPFLGRALVEPAAEVRYLLVARTTAGPRAGKRMKSPPRCLLLSLLILWRPRT